MCICMYVCMYVCLCSSDAEAHWRSRRHKQHIRAALRIRVRELAAIMHSLCADLEHVCENAFCDTSSVFKHGSGFIVCFVNKCWSVRHLQRFKHDFELLIVL